jgi:hypothetical protein
VYTVHLCALMWASQVLIRRLSGQYTVHRLGYKDYVKSIWGKAKSAMNL